MDPLIQTHSKPHRIKQLNEGGEGGRICGGGVEMVACMWELSSRHSSFLEFCPALFRSFEPNSIFSAWQSPSNSIGKLEV